MSLQVRTLLEEEEEVAVVTAHQLAEVLSWCDEETRDQMLISELCRAVERCGERQDLLASLLSCFSVISETCFFSPTAFSHSSICIMCKSLSANPRVLYTHSRYCFGIVSPLVVSL